ncbi:hypothetical protein GQ457_12G021480 [Hibiscus cannabinus]
MVSHFLILSAAAFSIAGDILQRNNFSIIQTFAEDTIAGFSFKQSMKRTMYIVMSQLRRKTKAAEAYEEEIDEAMRGMEDSDYDLWKATNDWEFSLKEKGSEVRAFHHFDYCSSDQVRISNTWYGKGSKFADVLELNEASI